VQVTAKIADELTSGLKCKQTKGSMWQYKRQFFTPDIENYP